METEQLASLEALIEAEDFGLEVLHPGGLETTAELASLCRIGAGSRVLDVASGTGEGASHLVQQLGATVVGLDHSRRMIERARVKADSRGLPILLVHGDAHRLPFGSGVFDAAISECTLSLLDKRRAIYEMVRVVRPEGAIGFHEVCWKEDAPAAMKRKLYDLEREQPETLQGWQELVSQFDVSSIQAVDRSHLIPQWMKQARKQLGLRGLLRAGKRVLQEWGPVGLWRVLQSERVFASKHTGYGIVVARKL